VKPLVTILMATYNGEKFLEEQLESLANQEGVVVQVIVNDDGSNDGTLEILNRWKRFGLIQEVIHSERIGACQAFFRLVSIDSSATFFAFCDQDDIWHPRKILTLIEKIGISGPQLAFCSRQLINEEGNEIGRERRIKIAPSFKNALVENIAPGNTIVLNWEAKELVSKFKNDNSIHYDSWIYLLVSAVGDCRFVNADLIKYRIHPKNLVGLRTFSLSAALDGVSNYVGQAFYLDSCAGIPITAENRQYLMGFIEDCKRFKNRNFLVALFTAKVSRNNSIENFIFKLLLIFAIRRRASVS